jgi:hypothetical protein
MEIRNDSKITFEAIGLSAYSNSKAGVLSYVAIFENLWKQSESYQAIRESNEKLEINDKILNEFIHLLLSVSDTRLTPVLSSSRNAAGFPLFHTAVFFYHKYLRQPVSDKLLVIPFLSY